MCSLCSAYPLFLVDDFNFSKVRALGPGFEYAFAYIHDEIDPTFDDKVDIVGVVILHIDVVLLNNSQRL